MSAPLVRDEQHLGEILDRQFSRAQLDAITLGLDAPSSIIAGAGSGKTTVMAARVVWLVGHLGIPPERILEKGRLQPGKMFLVDTSKGRIIGDDELKREMAAAAPYGQWLKENMVDIGALPQPASVIPPDHETVLRRQEMFGYTTEDLKVLSTFKKELQGKQIDLSRTYTTQFVDQANKPK